MVGDQYQAGLQDGMNLTLRYGLKNGMAKKNFVHLLN
jgi:hypothetical protein